MSDIPPRLIRVMEGVRELNESMPVELWADGNGRLLVRAYNEAGCNSVFVDLSDILNWIIRTANELDNGGPRTRDDTT
jgi:hypothetical protein